MVRVANPTTKANAKAKAKSGKGKGRGTVGRRARGPLHVDGGGVAPRTTDGGGEAPLTMDGGGVAPLVVESQTRAAIEACPQRTQEAFRKAALPLEPRLRQVHLPELSAFSKDEIIAHLLRKATTIDDYLEYDADHGNFSRQWHEVLHRAYPEMAGLTLRQSLFKLVMRAHHCRREFAGDLLDFVEHAAGGCTRETSSNHCHSCLPLATIDHHCCHICHYCFGCD